MCKKKPALRKAKGRQALDRAMAWERLVFRPLRAIRDKPLLVSPTA